MVEVRTRTVRRPKSSDHRLITLVASRGRITDLPPDRRTWFRPVADGVVLAPGDSVDDLVRIPQADANRLLKGLVRFVVDVPANSNLIVVWESGRDELQIDAGSIQIQCEPGLITVSVSVTCDELGRPRRVAVPFAVGRLERPRGLMMSTMTRVDAPAIIADAWSDALVAFCWEALLELVRRVSAEVGDDRGGRALIPGSIAAEERLLIVQPMARHDLSGLTR